MLRILFNFSHKYRQICLSFQTVGDLPKVFGNPKQGCDPHLKHHGSREYKLKGNYKLPLYALLVVGTHCWISKPCLKNMTLNFWEEWPVRKTNSIVFFFMFTRFPHFQLWRYQMTFDLYERQYCSLYSLRWIHIPSI